MRNINNYEAIAENNGEIINKNKMIRKMVKWLNG